jgi:hypothetical protein
VKLRTTASTLVAAAILAVAAGAQATTTSGTPGHHAAARHHHGKAAHHARAAAHRHHMRPAVAQWIGRNAAIQSRVATDVSLGRIAPRALAALEAEAAGVYRADADVLVAPWNAADRMRAATAERGLARAVAEVEHARSGERADALDRMHVRVATARDAEQQRWIAQGLRTARLSPVQASELERAQAEIVAAQSELERRGHETVDEALRMQHQQDVQDWAIRTGNMPGAAQA